MAQAKDEILRLGLVAPTLSLHEVPGHPTTSEIRIDSEVSNVILPDGIR